MSRNTGGNTNAAPTFTDAIPPADNADDRKNENEQENQDHTVKDGSENDNPGGLGYIKAPDGKRVPVQDYAKYEKEQGF